MQHVMVDGFEGHRSRLDDILLMHETLERLPVALDLSPTMPPIVTPYYNGFEPEDCGLSGFVFLEGGHITIHTFSQREVFFADIFSPKNFDATKAENLLQGSFPAFERVTFEEDRLSPHELQVSGDLKMDFGPHLLAKFELGELHPTLDWLFNMLDTLPSSIGMTPIMRPYVISNPQKNKSLVLSGITMIAESHVAAHILLPERHVYFDIFSCKYFDVNSVLEKLTTIFQVPPTTSKFITRGKDYESRRSTSFDRYRKFGGWRKV